MKPSTKLYSFLLLLSVLVLMGWGLRSPPLPVSVGTVTRGLFIESIEEEGRTVLRHPHRIQAPVTGYLRRIEWEEGDPVEAGQTLFVVESPSAPGLDPRSRARLQAEMEGAAASLSAATALYAARQADRAFAEREWNRNTSLLASRVIPAAEYDRLSAVLDQAREVENAARHEVEASRYRILHARAALETSAGTRDPDGDPVISVSPVEGVLLALHRRDEGPIQEGAPVLDIGSLDQLEVRVDLLSMDAVRVREGMEVILSRWGGEEDLRGSVRSVDPAGYERISALGVEEQRVAVRIALTTPRAERLRLGADYRVEARILLWKESDVLHIPVSALFPHDGGSAVFVAEGGRAILRPVQIGRRDGLRIQILKGLEEGARIITHVTERLGDGIRVRTGNVVDEDMFIR